MCAESHLPKVLLNPSRTAHRPKIWNYFGMYSLDRPSLRFRLCHLSISPAYGAREMKRFSSLEVFLTVRSRFRQCLIARCGITLTLLEITYLFILRCSVRTSHLGPAASCPSADAVPNGRVPYCSLKRPYPGIQAEPESLRCALH